MRGELDVFRGPSVVKNVSTPARPLRATDRGSGEAEKHAQRRNRELHLSELIKTKM